MNKLLSNASKMNWLESVLHFLSGETDKAPAIYGLYHIFCIVAIIAVAVVMCKLLKNASDKKFRVTVAICWAIVVAFEIYKQLIYSFDWNGTTAEWSYQWYAFPYQFCSMIFFVTPFAFLFKDGAIRGGAEAYLATYSLFGGLVVFIYPGDVFTKTIGINIQTMVHHGMQILLGVILLMKNREKLNFKFFLKGFVYFVALIGIAQILNASIPPFIGDQTFNMFYISWKYDCTLPLLSAIYPVVPYAVFLIMYVVGVTVAGIVIMMIAVGAIRLYRKISEKISAKSKA